MPSNIADQFLNVGARELPWPFAWTVQIYRSGGTFNAPYWAAQEVTIPNESSTLTNMAPENRGGWMPYPGVIERESFLARPLAVNFFDYGSEDPEVMAREWMKDIAMSGFRDTSMWGSTITCVMNDKAGGQRRTYNGRDVFPTNVEGFTMTYQSNTFTVKTITFSCLELDVS